MTDRYATYKGRAYKVLWIGKTKYGERAHLSFIDGTKDFWVDAKTVNLNTDAPIEAPHECAGNGRCVCAECGRPGKLVADLEDGLLKHRKCCDIEP